MKNKEIFILIVSVFVLVYLVGESNFGFTPITGWGSIGKNTVSVLLYVEIIWITSKFIKVLIKKYKKDNSEIENKKEKTQFIRNKKKLLIPLLVIAVVIIFYAGSKFNKQNLERQQQARQFELEVKCADKAGNFFYKDPSFQDYKNQVTDSYTIWNPPMFHYNKKLQTCLMSWEITNTIVGVEFKHGGVIDVLSNKVILKSESNPMNYDSYIPQRDVLMNE
ncbi:MAG: hypothetical protein WCT42_03225 [Candidatus Paceibacterota bacterium]